MSTGLDFQFRLPPDLQTAVDAALTDWARHDKLRRLWNADASLWTGQDEAKWLGWLSIVDEQLASISHLLDLAGEVQKAGYSHILLLGMGGSSLGPEVLTQTFGRIAGAPQLVVLDSTDPQQIRDTEAKVHLATTLVIVSSKSGSTLEPNILKDYFLQRLRETVGDGAAKHFVAVTDPGSPFEKAATAAGFGHIFHGLPSIGGRYSVLSDFGLVPAAAMGLDVERFLRSAHGMAEACGVNRPTADNPGVRLGLILGEAAKHGRDKLTLIASPGIASLGTWLEQLIAESTGKDGKGIIPIDREAVGPPSVYGTDRVFVYLRHAGSATTGQDLAVGALETAGQPVVRIELADGYDLPREFFRWEIATAVVGAVLGINPFNQPDVEASKIATRKLTDEYEASGKLSDESPMGASDGARWYADAANASALISGTTLAGVLNAQIARLLAGDYFAVLAYLPMTHEHDGLLQELRLAVRDAKQVATCAEFGPRFLHSTGQAYKGGPNSGVFLQLTCDDAHDLPVPGKRYTFGIVKAAQARGDLEVLAERGRRALRIHLGADVAAGLRALVAAARG